VSAYVTTPAPITHTESLVRALVDLGFTRSDIEVHEGPTPLYGYEGDIRAERADIVIRREFIGEASNDIGFERTPVGMQLHISEFERECGYDAAWCRRLWDAYERHHAEELKRIANAEAAAADLEAKRQAAIAAKRAEEERRQLVEAQRVALTEKAKMLGYRVQEKRQGDSLRLVLVKRTY